MTSVPLPLRKGDHLRDVDCAAVVGLLGGHVVYGVRALDLALELGFGDV